jgi:hypothetical protein
LDTLEVVRNAEKRGGTERREALEQVVIHAHQLGCDTRVGGGTAGGLNIRYGSIGYAVMDINTKGVVKLYAQPHPNKEPPEELHASINAFVEDREGLEPKSFPINTYGHLEEKIEDIDISVLKRFLDRVVELIWAEYYEPYVEEEYLGLTGAMTV